MNPTSIQDEAPLDVV